MKNKKLQWGILALVTFAMLLSLVLPPLSKPKAQAQRIHAVNHLASASITLARTNMLRDAGDSQQTSGRTQYEPYFTKQNPIPESVK
jgi:hypothetical protein